MATLNNSNIINGNTIQPNDILQLYSAFTSNGGYDVSISGSLTGSATSASVAISASFAVSSSRAVTSSFALNANNATNATNVTALSSSAIMASGSNPVSNYLSVAAGSITMTGSLGSTATSTALQNKILGTSIFINATITGNTTSGNVVTVRSYTPATGVIQLSTAGGTGTEFVLWTAYYIPS
jgi:hypothetical protein